MESQSNTGSLELQNLADIQAIFDQSFERWRKFFTRALFDYAVAKGAPKALEYARNHYNPFLLSYIEDWIRSWQVTELLEAGKLIAVPVDNWFIYSDGKSYRVNRANNFSYDMQGFTAMRFTEGSEKLTELLTNARDFETERHTIIGESNKVSHIIFRYGKSKNCKQGLEEKDCNPQG